MGDLKNSEGMEMVATPNPKDKCPENSFTNVYNEGEDETDNSEDINIDNEQNMVHSEGINLDNEITTSDKAKRNVVQDNLTHVDKKQKVTSKRKLVTCEFCNKEMRNKHYKQHLLVHKGIREFKCEICGKAFLRKFHLNFHIKSHLGVKDHKCHLCGRGFLLKTDMQRHMSVHTGQKEFKCEVCGKEFTQSSSLKSHMKLHTGAKAYKCQHCSKEYTKNSHLEQHMKEAHSGTKQFMCEICKTEYTRKSSLKYHMSKHSVFNEFEFPGSDKGRNNMAVNVDEKKSVNSDAKKFRCEICGKGLARKCNLRNHMLTHSKKRREDEMGKISEPEFVFIEMENFSDVKEEASSHNDREISPSDRSVSDMEYPSLKMEGNPLSEDYIPSEIDEEVYDNIVKKEECSDGIFLQ